MIRIEMEDVEGNPYAPPVTMDVVGTYSERFLAEEERQGSAMLRGRRRKPTGKMVREQQIAKAAACVVGWDGVMDGKEPVPCTPENVLRVLTAAPWMREQVEEAMNDHAGFSNRSSAPS